MAPVDQMEQELSAIRLLAIQQALNALGNADLSGRERAVRTLTQVFIDIVTLFGEQAAMSAARYLELDRLTAGVNLPAVVPADTIPFEQIERSLNWALRPLDTGDLRRAESQMAGSLQRMVSQPARDTVFDNTVRAGTRYARIPKPDACAFCLMLGSRGAVYTTEFIANRVVVGTVQTPGDKYHDGCRCESVEIRDDNEDQLPDLNRRLESMWLDTDRTFEGWKEFLRENPLADDVRY